MNKNLIRALGKSGFDFEDVAIFIGIFSNNLVGIIRGEVAPDESTKHKLAEVLDCKVSDLFPQNADNHGGELSPSPGP
jgi:DNA-binding XRE family transcriptional regulator